MTAEVAVMNRSAVALAADSAMSVGNTGKTYPTNKLFALSRQHPVGVMIYNNAEFMGVPWETLVKMHRHNIDSQGMATINDYAESFIDYISNDSICTDQQRIANLCRIASGLFRRMARDIRAAASDSASPQNTDIAEIVGKHTTALRDLDEAPSLQNLDADGLIRDQEAVINEIVDQCFSGLAVDDSIRRSLHGTLAVAIKSVILSDGSSGIVFAGFGEEEIFPSLVEVVTDGAIGDVVKAYTKQSRDVGRTGMQMAVVAFAQAEMVGRFMEGVDRHYLRYLHRYLGRTLHSVAREILETSAPESQLTEGQEADLHDLVKSSLEDFDQAASRVRQERFVQPVLEIVTHLPKEELASMAEALVNLTSLKRRVSMEEESVGGPIDVAVISKGDGFVWIKRKHYFEPSLNRDYYARQSLTLPTPPRRQK